MGFRPFCKRTIDFFFVFPAICELHDHGCIIFITRRIENIFELVRRTRLFDTFKIIYKFLIQNSLTRSTRLRRKNFFHEFSELITVHHFRHHTLAVISTIREIRCRLVNTIGCNLNLIVWTHCLQ